MLVDNNNVLNKDMTDTILAAFSEERYGEVTPHSRLVGVVPPGEVDGVGSSHLLYRVGYVLRGGVEREYTCRRVGSLAIEAKRHIALDMVSLYEAVPVLQAQR